MVQVKQKKKEKITTTSNKMLHTKNMPQLLCYYVPDGG